jgi:hypothetical protein
MMIVYHIISLIYIFRKILVINRLERCVIIGMNHIVIDGLNILNLILNLLSIMFIMMLWSWRINSNWTSTFFTFQANC